MGWASKTRAAGSATASRLQGSRRMIQGRGGNLGVAIDAFRSGSGQSEAGAVRTLAGEPCADPIECSRRLGRARGTTSLQRTG